MAQVPPETTTSRAQEGDEQVREPQILSGIEEKPLRKRLWIYTKLSGPGWLQSAITLGGGSLGSSLFLGVLAGFSLMWLQPLAMILGIVMLSAIGYVALSTGERPFRAINQHVNPVLGWGWALATASANIVWCLPQFSLAVNATRQNLLPGLLGDVSPVGSLGGKLITTIAIASVCIFVIWFYDKGTRGIRIFEWVLKIMVGIIIVCFFGVVIKMSTAGALDWGAVFRGLIPDLSMLSEPARTFAPHLAASGGYASYWSDQIVDMQRGVMISAFATAVGINMTFLLPYSMLAKGWRKNARGLAIFDLSTGLFIPFLLATGCIVITSAGRFHTEYHPALVGEAYDEQAIAPPPADLVGRCKGVCNGRVQEQMGRQGLAKLSDEQRAEMRAQFGADEKIQKRLGGQAFAKLTDEQKAEARSGLPMADKKMAAMITKRDAFNLAQSLEPLTGRIFSHYVFGVGVIGMAISSIIILMLISGFVLCEMIGVPAKGNAHRLACMLPLVGVLGPFIWSGARFWLVVPTSVFCGALIPIAYWTFFCLMNSRSVLGEKMPRGGRRVAWNVLMLIALAVVTPGSLWIIWNKAGYYGLAPLIGFLLLLIIVQVSRKRRPRSDVGQGSA